MKAYQTEADRNVEYFYGQSRVAVFSWPMQAGWHPFRRVNPQAIRPDDKDFLMSFLTAQLWQHSSMSAAIFIALNRSEQMKHEKKEEDQDGERWQ